MVKYNKKRFCLEGYRRAMTEGLVDSDWNYSNRSVGKKTKPQKAQLCFAQKILRSTKTIRMICNCFIFIVEREQWEKWELWEQ